MLTGSGGAGVVAADLLADADIEVAPLTEAKFENMYRRADQALYQAKGAGRNRYVIADVDQVLA